MMRCGDEAGGDVPVYRIPEGMPGRERTSRACSWCVLGGIVQWIDARVGSFFLCMCRCRRTFSYQLSNSFTLNLPGSTILDETHRTPAPDAMFDTSGWF